MTTRKFVSILILILAVLIITVSCATTPRIIRAVESGDLHKVKRLLDAGVNVNVRDMWASALIYASCSGYTDAVKLLIEAGADINATASSDLVKWKKWPPRHYHNPFVKPLGGTALIYASCSGHIDVVKLLIEAGADVNKKDKKNRYTVLMVASSAGQTEVAKLLIEAGANVNAQDNGGNTALLDASWRGETEIVKLLIEEGADVNAKIHVDSVGRTNKGGDVEILRDITALMIVSDLGHTEIVRLLIDAGVDVNTRNSKEYTALMWASENRHTEIVKLLKEAGAKEYWYLFR
jgi:ankyrin repeat protein